MPRKHSFDSKCLDLARYFYPHASESALRDLAQAVQDVIEGADLVPDPMSCPHCDGIAPRGVLEHAPGCSAANQVANND